jgi:hypothetical protein
MQNVVAGLALLVALLLASSMSPNLKSDARCSVDPWGCPVPSSAGDQTDARGSVDPWG